ncbi:MAG: hypothetical protein JSV19_03035 [Phycisphaerales bacterium]|nr:MAG: hypothetical protein JSV19_03035 [Phycisphaerales bacterium]
MYRSVLIAIALAVSTGCEKRKGPEFTATDPAVPWRDLIDEGAPLPDDDFILYTSEATKGLFPVSLAVARIAAIQPDEPAPPEPDEYELALNMEPLHKFLQWNSAFDDMRSVSEVFPLSRIAMNGQRVSMSSVVDATQAMTGRLCLLYAAADIGPTESEISGVLYRVSDGQPLAAIHARGIYVEPEEDDKEAAEAEEPENELEALLSPCTPRLVAEQRFRSLTRDCILKLLANDEPVEPAPEEGWVPQGPLAPQIWPPVNRNW